MNFEARNAGSRTARSCGAAPASDRGARAGAATGRAANASPKMSCAETFKSFKKLSRGIERLRGEETSLLWRLVGEMFAEAVLQEAPGA